MENLKEKSSDKIDNLQTILIGINCCIVGSVFTAPWAFSKSGWGFSLFLSFVVLLVGSVLGILLLQVMSRMKVLNKYSLLGLVILPVPFFDLFSEKPASNYIISTNQDGDNVPLIQPEILPKIKKNYDFIMMCKTLLTPEFEIILIIIVVMGSFLSLIGFSSIFSSTLVSLIPLGVWDTCDIYTTPSFSENCRYKYIFYVAIFIIILSVMTLFTEFKEHKNYLISICILRVIVILTMSTTSLVALYNNTSLTSEGRIMSDVKVIIWEGYGFTFPILFLSIISHLLIPDVIQPLRGKKKNAVKVLLWIYVSCFILVVLLGMTLYFGLDSVDELCTLNWNNYSNGKDPSDRDWWAYIIDVVVSAYPAFDVTTVAAIILENMTHNIISIKAKLEETETYAHWVFRIKIFVLVLTCLISMAFYDIGILLGIGGSISISMSFFFIVLFARASIILVPEPCEYDNFLTTKKWNNALMGVSVVFIGLTWVTFFFSIYID